MVRRGVAWIELGVGELGRVGEVGRMSRFSNTARQGAPWARPGHDRAQKGATGRAKARQGALGGRARAQQARKGAKGKLRRDMQKGGKLRREGRRNGRDGTGEALRASRSALVALRARPTRCTLVALCARLALYALVTLALLALRAARCARVARRAAMVGEGCHLDKGEKRLTHTRPFCIYLFCVSFLQCSVGRSPLLGRQISPSKGIKIKAYFHISPTAIHTADPTHEQRASASASAIPTCTLVILLGGWFLYPDIYIYQTGS